MAQTGANQTKQQLPPDYVGEHFDAVDNPLLRGGASSPLPQAEPELTASKQLVINKCFANTREYKHYETERGGHPLQTTRDFIFAESNETSDPAPIFDQLRWGGQFTFLSGDAEEVKNLATRYERNKFDIAHQPSFVRAPMFGLNLPGLGRKVHFFTARKTQLIRPGEITDRFTYQVELAQQGGEYVVEKTVPNLDITIKRLEQRFPEEDPKALEKHATKLIDKIFPVFLTREAAFLKLLRKHMPDAFKNRIPKEVGLEKDDKGMVRSLKLNWLRKRTEPITQLEFAEQAAELLHHLHTSAKIIHLDLRLDNIVVTDGGVGFVDFGSAARVNEDIAANPFLDSLFREMMKTSQIQRMLTRMTDSGLVTNESLTSSHHKVDKGVDLFYLAVQMADPQTNPDIKELVVVDETSDEYRLIKELTEQVLRPQNPVQPRYTSALELLESLQHIRKQLGR